MAAITVSGPPVERADEILTDEALEFVAELQRRFGARRDELLAPAQRPAGRIARDRHGSTSCPRPPACATGDWRVRRTPADLLDRRVEITGPTERKMTINALNSGAKVWLADLEDANTPHWANVVGGQVNLARRRSPHDRRSPRPRAGVPARRPRPDPGDRAAAARLAPRRAAPDRRRQAGRRGAGRLRALLLPQRPGAARARQRALLLPPEDGEPPRGAAVERRVRPRRRRRSGCRTARCARPC